MVEAQWQERPSSPVGSSILFYPLTYNPQSSTPALNVIFHFLFVTFGSSHHYLTHPLLSLDLQPRAPSHTLSLSSQLEVLIIISSLIIIFSLPHPRFALLIVFRHSNLKFLPFYHFVLTNNQAFLRCLIKYLSKNTTNISPKESVEEGNQHLSSQPVKVSSILFFPSFRPSYSASIAIYLPRKGG